MSEQRTCAPPPGTKAGSWHWLVSPTECTPFRWEEGLTGWQAWCVGANWFAPAAMAGLGYRYVSPIPTPDELAALRAENERLREALTELLKESREQASACDVMFDDFAEALNKGSAALAPDAAAGGE